MEEDAPEADYHSLPGKKRRRSISARDLSAIDSWRQSLDFSSPQTQDYFEQFIERARDDMHATLGQIALAEQEPVRLVPLYLWQNRVYIDNADRSTPLSREPFSFHSPEARQRVLEYFQKNPHKEITAKHLLNRTIGSFDSNSVATAIVSWLENIRLDDETPLFRFNGSTEPDSKGVATLIKLADEFQINVIEGPPPVYEDVISSKGPSAPEEDETDVDKLSPTNLYLLANLVYTSPKLTAELRYRGIRTNVSYEAIEELEKYKPLRLRIRHNEQVDSFIARRRKAQKARLHKALRQVYLGMLEESEYKQLITEAENSDHPAHRVLGFFKQFEDRVKVHNLAQALEKCGHRVN